MKPSSPRECLALTASLDAIPLLQEQAQQLQGDVLRQLLEKMDQLDELRGTLRRAIDPEAPLLIRDGGIFLKGYNDELDELRDITANGKDYVMAMERREREATGIKNLKIGYNKVFGYYIEVSKSNYDLVPYSYVRKQTLANCERFITQELKDLEQRDSGRRGAGAARWNTGCSARFAQLLKDSLTAPAAGRGRAEDVGCAAFPGPGGGGKRICAPDDQ